MRLNLCHKVILTIKAYFSPPPRVEEMEEAPLIVPVAGATIRRCANIKSRKNPDTQCPYSAIQGDFCSRHWKHPHRFVAKKDEVTEKRYTRSMTEAAQRIQRVWRSHSPFLHLFQQGPGYFARDESKNDTELYSLESIQQIPKFYYFSILDSHGSLWSFDIRTLGQISSLGPLKENPYTREPFTERAFTKINRRLLWLRRRKYAVLYPAGAELTQDQLWKQRILDLFMKIESFGFHVSCDWFFQMTIQDHRAVYKTLWSLWYARLGLTAAERDAIVPGYMSRARPLFRHTPDSLTEARPKHWWEKLNAYLIEAFLSRSPDKEQQKLGAMYCVMGLVAVCDEAATSFPWFEAILS